MRRFVLGLVPFALVAQTAGLAPEKKEFFESRIRPVLAQQCFACHTNSKMAGLRLDSREDVLKGGKSGPAVVPGDPDKSLLIAAVRQVGAIKMPKGGARLTEAEVADLATWIKDGVYWPVEAEAKSGKGYYISSGARKFWSIQPLRQPAPPK